MSTDVAARRLGREVGYCFRTWTAEHSPALERFLEFQELWGRKYPAVIRLWENAWAEFVPFLSFDVEIRKVVCTTNARRITASEPIRECRRPPRDSTVHCLYNDARPSERRPI